MKNQKDEKSIWERLGDIDVRIIWVIAIICLIIPFVYPLGTPIVVNTPAKKYAQVIDSLPSGSVVVLQGSVPVSFVGDIYPGLLDTLKHLMSKDLKIIIVSFVEDGPIVNSRAITAVNPEALGKTYGVDWVWFGYIAGLESGMASFYKNLRMLASDYYGTPTANLQLMSQVGTNADVDLVIEFDAFLDMGEYAVRQWASTYKKPLLIGTQSSNIPTIISYYNAGQVQGYLNGARGAAEYEGFRGTLGLGTSYSDATAFIVVEIVALIAIGNISLLSLLKKRVKKEV